MNGVNLRRPGGTMGSPLLSERLDAEAATWEGRHGSQAALELAALLREAAERIRQGEKLREELMRCGSLATRQQPDGRLAKSYADAIRRTAHEACWPGEPS